MHFLIEDSDTSPLILLLRKSGDTYQGSSGNGNLLTSAKALHPDVVVIDLPIANQQARSQYTILVRSGFTVAPIVCAEHCALKAFQSVRPVMQWIFDGSRYGIGAKCTWEVACKNYYTIYSHCGIDTRDCCGQHSSALLECKAALLRAQYPSGTIAEIVEQANRFVSALNTQLPKGYQPLPLQKISEKECV